MNFPLVIMFGVLAGILSGLLGIGGGTILVPIFIYLLKMDVHTAIGTSLAVIVPTAIVGSITHGFHGQVDWKMALIVAVLCVIGSFVGVKLNTMLPSGVLQKVFAVFLVIIAAQLFFGKT